MSVQSEREWGRNNVERIESFRRKMEENKEIPVIQVSDSQMSVVIAKSAKANIAMVDKCKIAINKLLPEVEKLADPYSAIKGGEEKYRNATDEQKKIYEKQIKFVQDNAKEALNAVDKLGKLANENSDVLVKTAKALSELNKTGQVADKRLQQEVNDKIKELGLKQANKIKDAEFDPLAPVSDDERAK